MAPSYPRHTEQTGLLLPTSLPPPFDPKHHSLSLEKASQPFLTRTLASWLIPNSYISLQYSSPLPLDAFTSVLMSKRRWGGEGPQRGEGGEEDALSCWHFLIWSLKKNFEGSYTSWNKFLSSPFSLSCAFSIIIFIAEISVRIHSESFYEAVPSVPSAGMTFPSL